MKHFVPRKASKTTAHRYDWASVDWTMNDMSIVKLLGCTQNAVAYQRRKCGAPPSPDQRLRVHLDKVDWNFSDEELARTHKCSIKTIIRLRSVHEGTTPNPTIHEWALRADWKKPNKILAKEYSVSLTAVARCRSVYAKGVKADYRAFQYLEAHIESFRTLKPLFTAPGDEPIFAALEWAEHSAIQKLLSYGQRKERRQTKAPTTPAAAPQVEAEAASGGTRSQDGEAPAQASREGGGS